MVGGIVIAVLLLLAPIWKKHGTGGSQATWQIAEKQFTGAKVSKLMDVEEAILNAKARNHLGIKPTSYHIG